MVNNKELTFSHRDLAKKLESLTLLVKNRLPALTEDFSSRHEDTETLLLYYLAEELQGLTERFIESCMLPFERVGSICLYVGNTQGALEEAQKNCQAMNGNLVEITQEQNPVIDFLERKVGSWGWAWIARTSVSNSNEWLRTKTPVQGHWVEVPDDSFDGCLKLGVEHGGYKPHTCTAVGGHYICEKKSCISPYELVGSKCLYVGKTEGAWEEAQESCQHLNGNLAEITRDQNAVLDFLSRKAGSWAWAWIARTSVSNSYEWLRTRTAVQGHWVDQGHWLEVLGDSYEGCLKLGVEYGGYKPYDCTDDGGHYICERSNIGERGNIAICIGGATIAGKCLTFSTEKLPWNDAKESCSIQNGRLATLNDPQAFKAYVASNYGREHFWIGGSDIANEATWVWLNDQPLGDQFPWYEGEPNALEVNEDCLALWGGYQFIDAPCTRQYGYVCEIGNQRGKRPGGNKCTSLGFMYCGVDWDMPGDELLSTYDAEKLLLRKMLELSADCNEPLPTPPTAPSPEDIEFRLYNSMNDVYSRLIANDTSSVDSSSLDPSLPLVVVTHGWRENVDTANWMHQIKDGWLQKEPINIILLQWNKLASTKYYPWAAAYTRFVGRELAALLNFLEEYTGLSPSNTHLIGFSLGAQVSGAAGYHLHSLSRITGLDPAGPLFNGKPASKRLDSSDAVFVDVIHTNRGGWIPGLGYTDPCGHVDFFMNGGYFQKGCILLNKTESYGWISPCSHHRAHEYYIESLSTTPEPSHGYECESQKHFEDGWCLSRDANTLGYGVTPNPTGVFYSNTLPAPSFLTRSILIILEAGGEPRSLHGKVFIGAVLPTRKTEPINIFQTTRWTTAMRVEKLLTVPSGTTLTKIMITAQYQKNILYHPYTLNVKKIEAYDSFVQEWYCVTREVVLDNRVVKLRPQSGRC